MGLLSQVGDQVFPEQTPELILSSSIAVAGTPMRLVDDESLRATPSKEIPPIAAGFELPALFAAGAVALEGGGKVEALLPAGLNHRPTQIVGIIQDDHLDASRGRALPDQLGGQLRGLAEGELQGRAVRWFGIEPEAIGNT
jgi:hypothetical protein